MKTLAYAKRCTKEIIRDPLNLAFALGFPIILLLLMTAIQANIPVELFAIERLSPGVCVFGLSFITLFSATLVSKDRSSAFLQRLYSTPLTPADFILGYTLPLIPCSVAQGVVCYALAMILGLTPSVNILWSVLFVVPLSFFYIALGLLCGSIFNDKQVGGICGALLTNLAGWLSGTWFDLSLVGGVFEKIANYLPFSHAVELERAVLTGNSGEIFPHLWWVLGYAAVTTAGALAAFLRQIKRQ